MVNIDKEREFHDRKMKGEVTIAPHYKLHVTQHSINYLISALSNIKGRRVLELGCGSGWLTYELSKRDGIVYAIDISDECLKETEQYLTNNNVSLKNINLSNQSASMLEYNNNYFDFVVCNALLHHTEIDKTIAEMHRVLNPGGQIIILEPLGHNLLLNIYRYLTPNYRSVNEKALKMKDVELIKRNFKNVKLRGFYLLSLLAFFFNKIFKSDNLFLYFYRLLNKIDDVILARFPFLCKYCWYILIIGEK